MEDWHLIVGLGNPGEEYSATRHNAGFMVVEQVLKRWRGAWKKESKYRCRLARIDQPFGRVLICQPLTYMNASGETVSALMRFYKVRIEKFLVIVDDADLPLGQIRMRPDGSPGGHHGLESVIEHVGSNQFARQRIGIGRSFAEDRQISNYVLGRFTAEERTLLGQVLGTAASQAVCWVEHGIGKAMNLFNGAIKNLEQRNAE